MGTLIVVVPELVELPPGVMAWAMRRIDPPDWIVSFWPSTESGRCARSPDPTLAMTIAEATETRRSA